jgi:hypothetical protein
MRLVFRLRFWIGQNNAKNQLIGGIFRPTSQDKLKNLIISVSSRHFQSKMKALIRFFYLFLGNDYFPRKIVRFFLLSVLLKVKKPTSTHALRRHNEERGSPSMRPIGPTRITAFSTCVPSTQRALPPMRIPPARQGRLRFRLPRHAPLPAGYPGNATGAYSFTLPRTMPWMK